MSQSEDFAWSIAFACMMTDFQKALISQYLVFFGAVFCTEQLEIICRMDFDMFFGILILSQSEDFVWPIAFACMMADFQNALISGIFSVFWSGFF